MQPALQPLCSSPLTLVNQSPPDAMNQSRAASVAVNLTLLRKALAFLSDFAARDNKSLPAAKLLWRIAQKERCRGPLA